MKKLYWKIRNFLEAIYQTDKGGTGLLAHKEDKRDLLFGGWFDTKPKYPSLTLAPKKWVFDQGRFNICVFAGQVMGDSYQEGKRFSIKFAVKCAKREGMISGNGFSYLRAGLKISKNYGRLPIEFMPDEISESWYEYSKWDVTDEMLKEAKKYRTPSYKRVTSSGEAIQALESGLILHTANRWYSSMNSPRPKEFLLGILGKYIGGHAWMSSGYITDNQLIKFEVLQSFGITYGKDGYAFIRRLFQKNNFPVYVCEKIEDRTEIQRFFGLYDGLCVKGSDSAIYLIEDGHKKPIKDWEVFKKMNQYPDFYNIEDKLLDKISKGKLLT